MRYDPELRVLSRKTWSRSKWIPGGRKNRCGKKPASALTSHPLRSKDWRQRRLAEERSQNKGLEPVAGPNPATAGDKAVDISQIHGLC